jgi:RND family efflux transporter MFP subunit
MRCTVSFGSLAGLLATVLAVGLVSGGCRRGQVHRSPPPPPTVTVSHPVEQEVVEWDEYTGHLEAVEAVDVRARVTGFVVAVPFKEGAIIKKGDLLFEIDVRPFQAELDAQKADEARAEARLYLAQVEYNRVKKLLSEQAAAPFEFQTADAALREAQAALAAAKAAVESAQLNVQWCRVTAPIAGRVGREYVNVGNLVSGGTGQATLLTTIQSIDPIYCYFTVPEQAVLKYQKLAREKKRPSARVSPTACYMELENETGFPHAGVIDFINNQVDPNTGTMTVRGIFPNPHGWLTPGFFARVRVPGSGRYKALLAPDSAVVTSLNEKLLYVVGPNDIVQARLVKLGALFGVLRAIREGIGPQDWVIVEGQMRVRPGMKVSPHEAPVATRSAQMTRASSPATQDSPATRSTQPAIPGTRPAQSSARATGAPIAKGELMAIPTGKLRRVRLRLPMPPSWGSQEGGWDGLVTQGEPVAYTPPRPPRGTGGKTADGQDAHAPTPGGRDARPPGGRL